MTTSKSTTAKKMTNAKSAKTTTTKARKSTPYLDLQLLKKYFVAKTSVKSIPLPTDAIYPALKSGIREFEEFLGIEPLPHFIIAVYKDKQFVDFKFPDIALVEDELSLVVDGQAYPLDLSHLIDKKTNTSKYSIITEGDASDDSLVGWLQPKEGAIKQLKCKLYIGTGNTEFDNLLPETDPEYLAENLYEYVFRPSVLDEGKHEVDYWDKEKFGYCVINNRRYFASDVQREQLGKRQLAGKETSLIVEKNHSKDKDGNPYTYKVIYIDGYRRAFYPKNLYMKYLPEIPETIAELEAAKEIKFQTPLEMEVLGLDDGVVKRKINDAVKEIESKLIRVRMPDGKEHNIIPSGELEKQLNLGKFDVPSFDGFKITVKSVRYRNGYSFKLDWTLPEVQVDENDAVLQNFEQIIGVQF